MNKSLTTISAFAMGLALLSGCANGKDAKTPSANKPEVTAMLAKADAVDGKTDQVVAKCALCGLGMDGKPEHAYDYSGYKLQFCSAGCRDNFAKDPEAGTMQISIPN